MLQTGIANFVYVKAVVLVSGVVKCIRPQRDSQYFQIDTNCVHKHSTRSTGECLYHTFPDPILVVGANATKGQTLFFLLQSVLNLLSLNLPLSAL